MVFTFILIATKPSFAVTDNYDQSETISIIGTSTSSSNYLNAIDGLTYNVTEVLIASFGVYQRRPNTNDSLWNECTNKENAYNYDGVLSVCDLYLQGNPGGYWWNNIEQTSLGTIYNVTFGVRLSTIGQQDSPLQFPDDYHIQYAFASTSGGCAAISPISWHDIAMNQFPGATLTWYNVTNITAVTWKNINNTCFRFWNFRRGSDDNYTVNIDAFHIDVNHSDAYRSEIEHNATGVSWSGTLNSINVSVNFSTNVTSEFYLKIYNFNSGDWNYAPCQNGIAAAGSWYNWWCNVTANPYFYNSSDGKVRVRLGVYGHDIVALVREDYVQYYISYTMPPLAPNTFVSYNPELESIPKYFLGLGFDTINNIWTVWEEQWSIVHGNKLGKDYINITKVLQQNQKRTFLYEGSSFSLYGPDNDQYSFRVKVIWTGFGTNIQPLNKTFFFKNFSENNAVGQNNVITTSNGFALMTTNKTAIWLSDFPESDEYRTLVKAAIASRVNELVYKRVPTSKETISVSSFLPLCCDMPETAELYLTMWYKI